MENDTISITFMEVNESEKRPCCYCGIDVYKGTGDFFFKLHLHACRKKHPEATDWCCPYNTSHVVPKPEKEYHLETCNERPIFDNWGKDPPIDNDHSPPATPPLGVVRIDGEGRGNGLGVGSERLFNCYPPKRGSESYTNYVWKVNMTFTPSVGNTILLPGYCR